MASLTDSPPRLAHASAPIALRKGKWTAAEDAVLLEYARLYGPKPCWSLLQSRVGKALNRDPKSCRLRYENHLRPGLQQGPLTEGEKQKIVDLQKQWGNRWALIASHLEGRTDNCVKNWWNSQQKQQKRKQVELGSHYHVAGFRNVEACGEKLLKEGDGESRGEECGTLSEVVSDSWSVECSVAGEKPGSRSKRIKKMPWLLKDLAESDAESSSCGGIGGPMSMNGRLAALNQLGTLSEEAESAPIQHEVPCYRKLKQNLRSSLVLPTPDDALAQLSSAHDIREPDRTILSLKHVCSDLQLKAAMGAVFPNQQGRGPYRSLFRDLEGIGMLSPNHPFASISNSLVGVGQYSLPPALSSMFPALNSKYLLQSGISVQQNGGYKLTEAPTSHPETASQPARCQPLVNSRTLVLQQMS